MDLLPLVGEVLKAGLRQAQAERTWKVILGGAT